MTMTLLETVQEFCDRTGIDRPAIVIASQDDQIRQIKALANEILTDITGRGESWPLLQKQTTFTTVAAEQQGLITTIAPYGFKYAIDGSLYDRTERRPLFGPRNAPRWQESEALPQTGPFYSYRIWQGYFWMQPAPPVGHTVAFEYASDYSILAADGTTWKKRFTADDDSFALNEDLLLLGLRWKWKAEKRLAFATEKLDYESFLAQAMGNDGAKPELHMDGRGGGDIRPGIFVPAGNWNV